MARILLVVTLVLFGALTSVAVWHHGYRGIFETMFQSWAGVQVLVGLDVAGRPGLETQRVAVCADHIGGRLVRTFAVSADPQDAGKRHLSANGSIIEAAISALLAPPSRLAPPRSTSRTGS